MFKAPTSAATGRRVMAECEQCNGSGECEVDYHMPHNTGRDVGEIETQIEQCDMCDGTGEIENDE